MRAGSFFSGGGLLLISGLLAFRAWLRMRDRAEALPAQSPLGLGLQNASRNPGRSLLTAGLLASAAFLLVAVESFRRTPAQDFAKKEGGSGGFDLVATMDVPLYQDPNDPATGRKEILDGLERAYQRDQATKAARLQEAENLLKECTLIPLRMRTGDDAGCRNLARPDKPRLIGVPENFIARGGFQFAALIDKSQRDNPWRLLDAATDKSTVNVFGEAQTVEWMLHSSIGGTIPFADSHGEPVSLRIAGTLQDSIFQGELVMSERRMLELFPESQGYAMLLAAAPPGRADELRTILETAYADRGLAATPAINRLTAYLAVENTYLSTFQILGGFGLLLGACGLAVVLLRSAEERRGELALLRAVGWAKSSVRLLIRSENLFLVLVGLGVGAAAALVGIAPMFFTGEASFGPLLDVAGELGVAIVIAAVVSELAVAAVTRSPIIAALRSE